MWAYASSSAELVPRQGRNQTLVHIFPDNMKTTDISSSICLSTITTYLMKNEADCDLLSHKAWTTFRNTSSPMKDTYLCPPAGESRSDLCPSNVRQDYTDAWRQNLKCKVENVIASWLRTRVCTKHHKPAAWEDWQSIRLWFEAQVSNVKPEVHAVICNA